MSKAHQNATLVSMLRHRAQQHAEAHAYTFLIDGEQAAATLTYGEVDRQARALAAMLQSFGMLGERALLIYPAGLEFITAFYGCLYAGVVAIPTQAPANRLKANQALARFQAIVGDARPLMVLTTTAISARLQALVDQIPELGAARWISTDSLPSEMADQWREPPINLEALAFLQYTSGSTAIPKGVMVSHRNLLANSEYIDYGFEHTPESIAINWLPHFHDMGLINGIIQPLFKAFRCFTMSPATFLQSPFQWLKAITRYRVTHS